MKREPISQQVDGHVCDLLFSQIKRPKNFLFCKAINVYDNRYRINVYTKTMVNDIESQRITYSCFAKLDNEKTLTILQQHPTGIAI